MKKEKIIEEMRQLAQNLTVSMFGTPESAAKAAKVIKEYLDCQTDHQILFLSEQFRKLTSMEWKMEWETADPMSRRFLFSEQEYTAILKIGMLHPNGYFREKCVLDAKKVFSEILPFLLICCNDWVKTIRKQAIKQARARILGCKAEELLVSFPYLEKLERSGRREQTEWKELKEVFYDRFNKLLSKVDYKILLKQSYECRKAVDRYLCLKNRPPILPLETMDLLLMEEKNGYLKTLLIQKILSYDSCSEEFLKRYCHDKNSSVRRYALYEKFHRCFNTSWDGLELFLLDSCRAIREFTAYMLKNYKGMNVNTYYWDYLDNRKSKSLALEKDLTVYAILGLGENNGVEYASRLERYLSSNNIRVVKSTLISLERMLGTKGETWYLSFLQDERRAVAKTAYLCIRNCGLRYGCQTLYEIICNTKQEHSKQYALLLLLKERSWKRIPYLILLYNKVSDELKEYILYDGLGQRNMFESVSKAEAERIRQLLDQDTKLPETLKEEIRFDLHYIEKDK